MAKSSKDTKPLPPEVLAQAMSQMLSANRKKGWDNMSPAKRKKALAQLAKAGKKAAANPNRNKRLDVPRCACGTHTQRTALQRWPALKGTHCLVDDGKGGRRPCTEKDRKSQK